MILNDSVQHEMEKFAEFNLIDVEIPEDTSVRIKEVVVSQLTSYAHIMESFHISGNLIKQLMVKFVQKYQLNEEYSNMLLSN